MGDPFLNCLALGILCFVVAVLFYGIIAIHDIPYLIAKSRNHEHFKHVALLRRILLRMRSWENYVFMEGH